MKESLIHRLIRVLDAQLIHVRKFINYVIIVVFAMMVLVVFSQVVWRFVFNNPFSWTEELARYLQVWLILLASVACIQKGRHLAVDYFTHILPFRIAKVLKLASIFCVLLFTAVLFFASIQLISITIHQITPAIRLPIMVVYLAFPISSLFMFVESLVLFLKMTSASDRENMKSIESGPIKI